MHQAVAGTVNQFHSWIDLEHDRALRNQVGVDFETGESIVQVSIQSLRLALAEGSEVEINILAVFAADGRPIKLGDLHKLSLWGYRGDLSIHGSLYLLGRRQFSGIISAESAKPLPSSDTKDSAEHRKNDR